MLTAIRKAISATARATGLTMLLENKGNPHPIILAYHRIEDLQPGFLHDETNVSASPARFREQMAFLKSKYHVMSLKEYAEIRRTRDYSKIRKNTVIITFDDGYRDNYENAYPVLRKHGFPATIFLTTDYIGTNKLFWWDALSFAVKSTGKKTVNLAKARQIDLSDKTLAIQKIKKHLKNLSERDKKEATAMLMAQLMPKKARARMAKRMMLTWAEVKEMRQHGIEFGAHTKTHPILTRLPPGLAMEEIRQSAMAIAKATGIKPIAFAYPNGHRSDFSKDVEKMVNKSGMQCAVTYIAGYCRPKSDDYALPRVFVRYEDDLTIFRNKLVGMDVLLSKAYRLITGE